MDPNGNIYRGEEDEIPPEDKARLGGFLTARAEIGEHARALEEAEAKVAFEQSVAAFNVSDSGSATSLREDLIQATIGRTGCSYAEAEALVDRVADRL